MTNPVFRNNSRVLLDSNILIYALNKNEPKSAQATKFITAAKNSCIAQQNVLETMRILTHPSFPESMSGSEIQRSIASIIEYFPVISPNEQTLYVFNHLVDIYKPTSNKIFDTYLVATALSNGIRTIVTDNEKDFRQFEQIEVLNPFS